MTPSAVAAQGRAAAVRADRPLLGVSCWSAQVCTAVGGLFAERLSGLRWSLHGVAVPPFSAPQRDYLGAVSCATRKMCMAVGTAYPPLGANVDYDYSALAEVTRGGSWSDRSPGRRRPKNGFFQAVSCPSASECIAVGQAETSPLATSWDGRRWRVQLAPVPTRAMSILNGVFCSSTARCVAVGYMQPDPSTPSKVLIETWNGAAWSKARAPTTPLIGSAILNAVSCSGGSCTAVGNVGLRQLVERWNGREWSIQRNPKRAPDAGLNGVSCVSPADCVAVGNRANSSHQAIAERWNGRRWSIEHTPDFASGSILWSVSCVSAGDCVAAGESAAVALIERLQGTTWSIQAAARPAL